MSKFKVGDKIRRIDGDITTNNNPSFTVNEVDDAGGKVWLKETNTWIFTKHIELATHTKPPHKHRDLIIAWANGADIQFRCDTGDDSDDEWDDIDTPTWLEENEYRVKPEKSKRDIEIEAIQQQLDNLQYKLHELKRCRNAG